MLCLQLGSSSQGFCNNVYVLKGCSWARFPLQQSNPTKAEGVFVCPLVDSKVCLALERINQQSCLVLGPREMGSRQWSLSWADEQVNGRSGKKTQLLSW